jgi:hypothetical protein
MKEQKETAQSTRMTVRSGMGGIGLEPTTSRMSTVCSNQLS